MPASHETVANRPLSGTELKEIIINDFLKILDRDGMLSDHIGYGQVAYEVEVRLHLANPFQPEHKITVRSNPASKNQIAKDSGMEALSGVPINPEKIDKDESGEPTDVVSSSELSREINSPNLARVANGLPINVTVSDVNSGTKVTREVTYDKRGLDPSAPEVKEPEIRDTSNKTRDAWKLNKSGAGAKVVSK